MCYVMSNFVRVARPGNIQPTEGSIRDESNRGFGLATEASAFNGRGMMKMVRLEGVPAQNPARGVTAKEEGDRHTQRHHIDF